jgi:hypothetical protein
VIRCAFAASAALLATFAPRALAAAPSEAAGGGANVAQPAPSADGVTGAPGTASDERLGTRAAGFFGVALGMPGADFVNELVGARFELVYTPRFSLGMSLAYVNLKGKDGRVSNALPEVSVAYRAPLGESIGVPLRLSAGYLPMNGPTLRLTSGFDFAFSDTVALEVALIEPMVWVTRDRPELSLNAGAGVRAAF